MTTEKMPIVLKAHQEAHVSNLLTYLDKYGIGIDTSGTGAGKTFSSMFIAEKLNLPIVLISPKSISLVWEKLCEQHELKTHSISSYTLIASRRATQFPYPVLVICDEFHYLKNNTKRYRKIRRMLTTLPEGSKVLLLSATPYDKETNALQMSQLFNAASSTGTYRDVVSSMRFEIPHPLIITKGFYEFSKPSLETYSEGVSTLHKLSRMKHLSNPPPMGVVAGLITKGTKSIHEGSIEKLIEIGTKLLTTTPTLKVVVVVKFHDHLDEISDALKEFGVVKLDGRTKARLEVIEKFQAPNTETRVIVTSAQVGGVGVNLDDQHGGFPREMLVLPTYECIDLIQCVGRIHRTSTMSSAGVTIVNSVQCKSPIEASINRKIDTISKNTDSVEKFVTMKVHRDKVENKN